LLERCGVRYQSDWFDPQSRAVFWLFPNHPILNQPNRIGALHNSQRIWLGDLGDLFESSAVISGAGSQQNYWQAPALA
jgi:hypothetical protein